MSVINIACPRCQGRVSATKSHRLSSTVKEITFLCKHPPCAHVFMGTLKMRRTLAFTLTISSPPLPDVTIELSKQLNKQGQSEP